jgi:hypothetical protein
MKPPKQSRRKPSASKLEPIDWREFANDAVLNGNMSTLYRRPPTEDPSAYASAEAMIEIEKRVIRPVLDTEPINSQPDISDPPTVGVEPTVGPRLEQDIISPVGVEPRVGAGSTAGVDVENPTGTGPTVGLEPRVARGPIPGVDVEAPIGTVPTVGIKPRGGAGSTAGTDIENPIAAVPTAVGTLPTAAPTTVDPRPTDVSGPTVGLSPTECPIPTPAAQTPTGRSKPTVGIKPTVGSKKNKKVRPIRSVQDGLTLAGQVLYRAMLGSSDGPCTSCTKGYRQLAAETHLDKDTVRDLIVEFKNKGIVHETATYDPDTRLSKTYEVLSHQAILEAWRESGIFFVTAGRQRPLFCSATGDPVTFIPTVGTKPSAGS